MDSLRCLSNKTRTTSSIPIPEAHIRRTNSEIQLENDKLLYEWREGVMYHRLVTGMIQRSKEVGYHPTINKTVQNVIQKRQASCEVPDAAAIPSSDSGYISGSSSCSSYGNDGGDAEWLFYDEVQDDTQVPLSSTWIHQSSSSWIHRSSSPSQADPQDCPPRRHSCPSLALCAGKTLKEDGAVYLNADYLNTDYLNRDGADDDDDDDDDSTVFELEL